MTLDELEALAKKATPAPWHELEPTGNGVFSVAANGGIGGSVADCCNYSDAQDKSNAELIAAMRNALPALLAAIRAADAMRDTTLPGTSDRHYAACLDYDAKRREVEA